MPTDFVPFTLYSHAAYVDTHPECADDLAAYRSANKRMAKRASHHNMARNLNKRDATLYYIIPQDHLQDMATRAFSSAAVNTFGGYVSTTLSLWNKVRRQCLVEAELCLPRADAILLH